MKFHSFLASLAVIAGMAVSAFAVEFEKKTITTDFLAEGAACADFDGDGFNDITYGPYIFWGPDFQEKDLYRPFNKVFDPHGYSDQFLAFTDDLDRDGHEDIIQVPWPGESGDCWFNPGGKRGAEWRKFFISKEIGNESQVYIDVDGNGRKDLCFNRNGFMGFATYNPENKESWDWHALSNEDGKYQRYFHGIGAGDVNSDGLCDQIDSKGWYENPGPDAPNFQGVWTYHPFEFAQGASTICVWDVDGDGVNDVICAWSAHLYGLLWWKGIKNADGSVTFEKNEIQPIDPENNPEGKLSYTQMHSVDYADINGDGLTDFVTGKRWWAHGPTGDKEADQPAVLYWYEGFRKDGKAGFIPHQIDDNSGVGTQITIADINKDGKPDVISGNKKGLSIFIQK